MSGMPGPLSANSNSRPICESTSIERQRIVPCPAYLKMLRAISEQAVTTRVTSVGPNPACWAASRMARRTRTMSASVLIAISLILTATSLGWVSLMTDFSGGVVGEKVQRPIDSQRGFDIAQLQADFRG